MSWKAVDLGENEAKQKAMDLNVVFDQYGERTNADRREVRPPVIVVSATWQAAGELDYWVRERGEWWGRVRYEGFLADGFGDLAKTAISRAPRWSRCSTATRCRPTRRR